MHFGQQGRLVLDPAEGKLNTLAHETWDDAVKAGALVALTRGLLGQLQKVLGSLRHNILLQLQRSHRSCVVQTSMV